MLKSATLIADLFCSSCKPYVDALNAENILDLFEVSQLSTQDWQDLRQKYQIPIGWKVFLILKAQEAILADGEAAQSTRNEVIKQRVEKQITEPKIELDKNEIKAQIQKQATIRMERNQNLFLKGPQPVAGLSLGKKAGIGQKVKKHFGLGLLAKALAKRKDAAVVKQRDEKLQNDFEAESKQVDADEMLRLKAVGLQITPSRHESVPPGTLKVYIKQAKDLIASDFMGKSDPFVVVRLVKKGRVLEQKQTKTIYNNLNPVWEGEVYEFDVGSDIDSVVQFIVYDRDLIGKDHIGEISCGVNELSDGESDVWLPLQSCAHGQLNVKFVYESSSA